MQELPRSAGGNGNMPPGLSIESAGNNLASLVMTDAMQALVSKVLRQWKSPEAFSPLAKYGIYPIRQLLFFGPPGNGKTSACQWLAQRLTVPLYRVRCEQLVEAYLGRTATNVGKVMDWLSKSPPAIILFDEIESLFPARGVEGSCAREVNAAMTAYWQYLDRWAGRHLFVMATNMPDKLDPALMSRIELHLEFGPPTDGQLREVIAYWAEVLHDFGGADWSQTLLSMIDQGETFESFRALWQAIQSYSIAHVSNQLPD